MRGGRARTGIRIGTDRGLMPAIFFLIGGIAGFIGLLASDAGADALLQMLGWTAARPAIGAFAGGTPEADAADRPAGSDGSVRFASAPDGAAPAAPAPDVRPGEPEPSAAHASGLLPPAGGHGGVRTADAYPGLDGSGEERPAASGPTTDPPEAAPMSAGRVALTFDDGPDGKYTPMVLDILAQYGVPATFFVVGTQVERYPDVLARIRDEGHEIGSHGYTHADMARMKAEDAAEDLRRADEAIREAAGIDPTLFRPPYGSVSDHLKSALAEAGKTLVRWNVDPRDWDGTPADAIASHVLEHAKDGAVVLLHSFGGKNSDLSGTIEALPAIIEGLLAQGYELVTVSGLERESG